MSARSLQSFCESNPLERVRGDRPPRHESKAFAPSSGGSGCSVISGGRAPRAESSLALLPGLHDTSPFVQAKNRHQFRKGAACASFHSVRGRMGLLCCRWLTACARVRTKRHWKKTVYFPLTSSVSLAVEFFSLRKKNSATIPGTGVVFSQPRCGGRKQKNDFNR